MAKSLKNGPDMSKIGRLKITKMKQFLNYIEIVTFRYKKHLIK